MAGGGGQDGALVEADDVAVVEGSPSGLEVAARIELEGVLGALDVGDLDALAVAEGTTPPGLPQDLLSEHAWGQRGHGLLGHAGVLLVVARGCRGDGHGVLGGVVGGVRRHVDGLLLFTHRGAV